MAELFSRFTVLCSSLDLSLAMCVLLFSEATFATEVENSHVTLLSDSAELAYSDQQSDLTNIEIYNVAETRTMSVEDLRQLTCSESAAIGERMFRCELCQSVVPAGTRSSKVVLVTRNKTYDERGGGGFAARGGFRKRGPSRSGPPKKNFDKGGDGQEIVREVSVCPACAENHQRQQEIESLKANEGAE